MDGVRTRVGCGWLDHRGRTSVLAPTWAELRTFIAVSTFAALPHHARTAGIRVLRLHIRFSSLGDADRRTTHIWNYYSDNAGTVRFTPVRWWLVLLQLHLMATTTTTSKGASAPLGEGAPMPPAPPSASGSISAGRSTNSAPGGQFGVNGAKRDGRRRRSGRWPLKDDHGETRAEYVQSVRKENSLGWVNLGGG